MVETRSASEIAKFVTGQETVDPSHVEVGAWVEIIRHAIEDLPVNYLRGLKSLKQNLESDGPGKVRNRVTSLPQVWNMRNALGNKPKQNEVFLQCAMQGEPLPASWSEAPRVEGPETSDRKLATRKTEHLLLSRHRTLFLVSVLWLPKTKWAGEFMEPPPPEFWYEEDPTSWEASVVDDDWLAALLVASHGRRGTLGLSMLQHFFLAAIRAADDSYMQFRYMEEKKGLMAGYLSRLGLYF